MLRRAKRPSRVRSTSVVASVMGLNERKRSVKGL